MSTSNLKISIAALSLCVSAVAIYIHLPYVIAAVSGSGAIEAVPLAIFAVSAIVALVSVICLIRLAVSRAGDKKKIDLSGEESGHTVSQEPQEKSVEQDSRSQIKVDSSTSSQDKSSVPTSPSQSSQTRVTAVPHVPHSVPPSPSSPPSAAPLPPPPLPPPVTQIDPLAVYRERIKNKTGATASTFKGSVLEELIERDKAEAFGLKKPKSTDKDETREARAARLDNVQKKKYIDPIVFSKMNDKFPLWYY
ncbi:hypothetical protein [Wolbachia endosymbiont of Psylliodes chrysocephala]|uniref:hypothetical protein n=1 Tax=Wolbachia endosymbiont of Psylliodes chrysocephala TaxID=2883236 RepID=UPI0020A0FE31|nr:hypothetical protein [Wolbachia endosymbiont of Psylliodes chrysocephala]